MRSHSPQPSPTPPQTPQCPHTLPPRLHLVPGGPLRWCCGRFCFERSGHQRKTAVKEEKEEEDAEAAPASPYLFEQHPLLVARRLHGRPGRGFPPSAEAGPRRRHVRPLPAAEGSPSPSRLLSLCFNTLAQLWLHFTTENYNTRFLHHTLGQTTKIFTTLQLWLLPAASPRCSMVSLHFTTQSATSCFKLKPIFC